MEVIVATVIATIAVLGFAHSFGLGRALIERFTFARTALATAEERMEALSVLPSSHPALEYGQHDSTFVINGETIGTLRWDVSVSQVAWSTKLDTLKQVVVEVEWNRGFPDTVRLSRMFQKK